MTDVVEVAFDVGIDNPGVAGFEPFIDRS